MKTFHIIIDCEEDKAQDLFEDIQNKYRLYDNCVLETTDEWDWEEENPLIIIEGKDLDQIINLCKNIFKRYARTEYDFSIRIEEVDMKSSILEKGRMSETGCLSV